MWVCYTDFERNLPKFWARFGHRSQITGGDSMRRVLTAFLILCLLSACSIRPHGNEDPGPPIFARDPSLTGVYREVEMDPEGVYAYLDSPSFPASVQKIDIHVVIPEGTSQWVYMYPLIEIYEHDHWIRLLYDVSDMHFPETLWACTPSHTLRFWPKGLSEPLRSGRSYRFIVYVDDTMMYLPFTVE